MSDLGKPTLIHLANSTSQSILWLLEELGIEYDIREYPRPSGLAPPELKETHPQGKSPQLLLADGRVITQTSAIALYLIRTYDAAARRFQPAEDDPVREEELVCLGVADAAVKAGLKLLLAGLVARSPFFVRPVFSFTYSTVSRMVLDADIAAVMAVLEARLDGRDWLMDGGAEGPTRPDFVLRFFVDLLTQNKFVDLDQHPRVKAWHARIEARDGWKRALQKGNGYDLNFLSFK